MTIWRNIEKIVKEQARVLREMTSLSSIVTRTGKKPTQNTSNPTITMSSPAMQKSMEGLSKTEKSAMIPTMQAMQTTLTMIQETMQMMQEKLSSNHTELKTDIKVIDQKISDIQQSIQMNEQKINKMESKIEQQEKNLDAVDQKLMTQNRELEDSITQLEMDKASFYLHFQNITEEKDENLGQVMAELIAGVLQRDQDEVIKELDEIYRVQTSYARRNKLPREVHIRFAQKKVKDIFYNMVREEPISYKGKEVIVLKQVLRRVREIRRDYRFLAVQLNKRHILFRWTLPEGMLITWHGKRIKIGSLIEAQEFLDQLKGTEEDQSSKEELEENTEEDLTQQRRSKEGTPEEEEIEEKESKETKKKERPQRTTRANKN